MKGNKLRSLIIFPIYIMSLEKKHVPYAEKGVKEEDEKVLKPYTYLLQNPGKNIRDLLAHAFNFWLKLPSYRMQTVSDISRMLHNTSLLIDDIEDNSILRRGNPVAHLIYGVARTLKAVNYLLFIGFENILFLNHSEAIPVYIEEMLQVHRGQGMDIYFRDNFICPTEEEYKTMVIRKTGGVFNCMVRLMQLDSDYKEDLTTLSEILGLYYQIRDDYCNLFLLEYKEKKGYCEDLTEGKFSFPIVHAIRNHPEDNQVLKILRQRTTDEEVKRNCVKLLEKYGSFKYTENVLSDLDKKARKEIERLGGNPYMISFLDKLLDWKQC